MFGVPLIAALRALFAESGDDSLHGPDARLRAVNAS